MFLSPFSIRNTQLGTAAAVALLSATILHAAPADTNTSTDTNPDDLGVINVIAADRISTPLKDTTANVTVITAEEIKERGYQTLSDAVSRISGFAAASNGGPGQTSGLYLRGMGSGDILILLDGIPLKDPTDPSFSAGLAHIRLDDVARIEVVKGAQSGLWGADAAAGVINIVTRSAAPGGHASLRGSYGSYDTWTGGMTLSSSGEIGSFILSGDHFKTQGFSALKPRDAEADSYTNDTLDFKGRLNISPNSSIGIFYHQIQGTFDYDSYGFDQNFNLVPLPNDSISNGTFDDRLLGLDYRYRSDTLSVDAKISSNQIDRHMEDLTWGPSDYQGEATRATLSAFYTPDSSRRFGGGVEYNRYEGSSTWSASSSYDNRAIWGSYRQIWDRVLGARTILDLTVRYDDFSTFKNKTTYRIGLKRECQALPGFFTAASLASAYKAPSLYQYTTNTALKPESTDSFEISAGYEELIKVTYFRNKVKDRIDYDFATWSYFNNPNDYTVDGIEVEGSYRIDTLDTVLSANYTHLFKTDDENGNPILRVPKNSANLFADYYLSETIHLGANLQYVDKRLDYGNKEMGSYTLVNLSYNQQITERLTLSIQAHNIFDRDYETAAGYSTEGRSVYGKMEYRF